MLLNGDVLEVRIDQKELDKFDDLITAGSFLEMSQTFGYGYYMNDDVLSGKITGVENPELIISEAKKIFVLVQVDLRYADEHKTRGILN